MNLQAQISWQAQYKMRSRMRSREIVDARNAVFFNRRGGFEAGKSSFAERCVRDGLGSFSDHNPIMVGLFSESSLHCDYNFHLFLDAQTSWQAQHFVNAQIMWQAQHFVNLHVQNSWQAQHFVNLHALITWQAQHFCEA